MQITARVERKASRESFERLREHIGSLKAGYVVAGLPKDSDPYPDGTSVVQVGVDHEFGSKLPRTYVSPRGNSVSVSGVPERSFMRSTFAERKKAWTAKAKMLAGAMMKHGFTAEDFFQQLGFGMQVDIQKKIKAIQDPPNSPQVVSDKGSNSPLIDTGHLIGAITFDVRNGGDND